MRVCADSRRHGASILTETEVTGLGKADDGRVVAVETTPGDVECDTVVLAAGTAVTQLAASAGVSVPQERSPGVVIRTNPLPPLLEKCASRICACYGGWTSGDTYSPVCGRQNDDWRGKPGSLAEDDSQLTRTTYWIARGKSYPNWQMLWQYLFRLGGDRCRWMAIRFSGSLRKPRMCT